MNVENSIEKIQMCLASQENDTNVIIFVENSVFIDQFF